MIKKEIDQDVETRDNMRGGTGSVTIRHYFSKQEINASCRLCAELTLPPQTSIGKHEHTNEDEIFIVQHGTGIMSVDEKEIEVKKGDAILTGKGAAHAIKNVGAEKLVITALIMLY